MAIRGYTKESFLLMTVDPVHVGAGGHRLGRVDMTIAREPGTNLPKIPGTTLAGAARSYAAARYGKREAAGQHKTMRDKERCPIVYTFGTATEAGGGQAGTVSIGDAQLLLFPAASLSGPLWVSTREILEGAGFRVEGGGGELSTAFEWIKPLNVGWMLFEAPGRVTITPPAALAGNNGLRRVLGRTALAAPEIFAQITASNLEVRTSVSIDAETGAAKDGALFTYEALPRATWLVCEVIEEDYHEQKRFPATDRTYERNGISEELGERWERPLDVVKSGLRLAAYLGIGGMGTRGFGRMALAGAWAEGGER